MKSMSIARQLAWISIAMGRAGAISVVGFTFQQRRVSALHKDVTARTAEANARRWR
jgi:hypothetical protein